MRIDPNGSTKSAAALTLMRTHARQLRDASRKLRVYAANLVADSRRLRARRGRSAPRSAEADRGEP